ncbi:TonB-dependent receptor [Sphingomonas sp. dw_22]|uniref:TonB-dependent receptor n=1 Tax=Sphingomonas sp. dw_22 TaxID=2721175 RepID=UPI001BD4F0B0|nr:TonB-dependent receptor [Sphingomonas sp. dw_22]
MRVVTRALTGVATLAIVSGMSATAFAQDAQSQNPPAAEDQATVDQEIVVTGIRASISSAQSIKRNSDQIVDSIVAEDIGKLPDVNVAEALQRVSGIQVARDRGEGAGIAIRGLTQVLTTMNGREVFTAGDGRSFNLQDVPAELVAGLDVYKTPSANLIEGGIGGVVDVRTRKPLDKKGLVVSGSLRARYSDLPDKVKPLASLLLSNTWNVGSEGELGILISGAYQERAFGTDLNDIGSPLLRDDVIPGQTVVAPNGSYQPAIGGNRRRIGLDGMIQYKPNPDLEFYAQASYQDFNSIQNQFGLNIPTTLSNCPTPAGGARRCDPIPGTAVLAPGTNDVQKISYANVPFSTFGVSRDTYDENQQYSAGAKWDTGPAHLSLDVNYSKSKNTLYYAELDLAGVAPRIDQDITTTVPTMKISGIDLNDINSFTVGSMTLNQNYYTGELKAIRGDASFDIESDFLKSMDFGFRLADRTTDFKPVRFFQTKGGSAAPYSSLFIANPLNDMFSGSTNIDQNFLVADFNKLRGDFDGVREQLGIAVEPAVTPLGIYSIHEKTYAGYAMAKFKYDGGLHLDGNIGIRIIKTSLQVVGNRATFAQRPGTGTSPSNPAVFDQTGFAPVNVDTSYVTALPSANIRFKLTDKLQLRLAASQAITRPNFGQLAPTLTLVPGAQTGSSGNPDLSPLKSDQLDASLEYYFSPTGSVYAAAFYRKVEDFIQSSSRGQETIDGIVYQITRPANSGNGKIKGFEVGGQTFFDFLPGLLSGFGVQANYTFVDSNTTTSFAGLSAPLSNLSKNSFNVSGIYEKGPVSARIAYNWRDKFLTGITGSGSALGNYPTYRKPYGWLDASLSVDITKQVTFTLEGSNLTRAKTDTYFDVPTRRGNWEQDDIQVMAGVRFTL